MREERRPDGKKNAYHQRDEHNLLFLVVFIVLMVQSAFVL